MIILMRKKSLWVIGVLLLAIIFFWGGYLGLKPQEKISYEQEPTVPTLSGVNQMPETLPAILPTEDEPVEQVPPAEPVTQQPAVTDDGIVQMPDVIESSQSEAPVEMTSTLSDEIIDMRAERNRNRDRQFDALKQLASNTATTPSVKVDAESKMIKISEEKFVELQTENLLRTKGYQNIVVMIDFANAKIYVGEELAEDDYVKIGDLVHKSTNFSLEEIIIIPK